MAQFQKTFSAYYETRPLGDNEYEILDYWTTQDTTLISTDGDETKFNVGESLGTEPATGGGPIYLGTGPEGVFVSSGGYVFYFSDTLGLQNLGETRTLQEINATCFLQGVLIDCPDGAKLVESLSIGDLVRTADGSTAPVRWIGRQTFAGAFADELRALPIRISCGALGPQLPSRDLYLSPDHAVLIGDVLVHASALVNGTTVQRLTRTEVGERFTYYHLELDEHTLVLADGVAAESFVPNVSRRQFDNFREYRALFGTERSYEEMDYPRAKSARQLPGTVRAVLAEAAEAGMSKAA